jgi:ferredoxin
MKEAKNLKQENRGHFSKLPTQKYRLGGVWLNVLPDDLWLRIPKGESVWEALQSTDVELESDCGGLGTCGKCKIKVLSEIDPPSLQERELLDEQELRQGIRLACRTRVFRDTVISTIEAEREEEFFKILTTSHHLAHRYIPTAELEPLVSTKCLALSPDIWQDGLSDLDAIKLGLGGEYADLKAPLNCLHTLTKKLKETQFCGTAVLHEHCLLDWQMRWTPSLGQDRGCIKSGPRYPQGVWC